MIFQRPNHFVYCVLAQLLERTKVSKFRFFPWLNSGKCPCHATCMAAGPATLPGGQVPPSLLAAMVTGNQADTAPPTSTSPTQPSSQVGSASLARYPSWDETSEAASSRSSTKPKKALANNSPATPSTGDRLPSLVTTLPPQFPPPPRPPLPNTSQPGKEELVNLNTKLQLGTHLSQKQQKTQSTKDQLICKLNARL